LAITAEALNTMTKPTKTKSRVTINMSRSTLMRLAMENPFHHGHTEMGRTLVEGSGGKQLLVWFPRLHQLTIGR
jgi:hypothetical protein